MLSGPHQPGDGPGAAPGADRSGVQPDDGGAYGTGSLMLVAVGAVADQVGMHATLAGVTAIGLIASSLSLRLPKENGPPGRCLPMWKIRAPGWKAE